MKSFLVAAAFGLALGSAQAADGSAVKPLIGIGVTFGGDTLATVQYTNGDSDNIKSGGLIALYGGAEFRLGDQVGLQATVGYHVDDSRGASNGGLRFSRYPIDLVALYSVNDKVRLGLGLQHVNSPKLAGSGVASNVSVDFEASTGAVLEAEYLFTPRIGLKVRGVTHKFKPKGGSGEIDGNHYGLLLNYYF